MDVSITAVSRNRKFGKSLVRHADALKPLRLVAMDIGTESIGFDILQLVFIDGNQESFKAVGCKRDRLFRVEVPIPSEVEVDYDDASAFAGSIRQRLRVAATLCGLPTDIEQKLLGAIER